jgi:hypothetical protein
MADTYKSDIHHRLDQGLKLKYEWRPHSPSAASSTDVPTERAESWDREYNEESGTLTAIVHTVHATTPVDYAALGREGNAIRRAQREASQTPVERSSYRQGYLAGSQAASRMRAVLGRALRDLMRGGGREIL